jgi:copper homeostasis protein (lipoprotein)
MQICKLSFFFFFVSFSIFSCQSTESTNPGVNDSSVVSEAVETPVLAEISEPVFFSDTIPCANCPGIVYQLSLTTDSTYIFSEEYLGQKKSPYVQFGKSEKKDSVITLFMPDSKKVKFQITDTGMLLMDRKAGINTGKEDFNLDSRPNGSFDLAQLYIIDGAYFYSADAANFTPCGQGNTYLVKPGGASFEAEKLFLNKKGNENEPIYLRALISIKQDKSLTGMDQIMVIMEKVLSKLDSTDCR